MTEPKKCIVEYRLDTPHVPWVVVYGDRMVVSRHELKEHAERVRDKLNLKIERRVLLDVVARIREDGLQAEP